MRIIKRGGYSKLIQKMEKAPQQISRRGTKWAFDNARQVDAKVRHNLETQGRGGEPPPLSYATREIYRQTQEPDGSGIINHLTLEFQRRDNRYIATLGIPEGRPTMIAKVQDQGATIPVTERMRAYFAVFGIYLKPTTTHINVPGRKFWEIALRESRKESQAKLKGLLKEIFRSL